MRLGDLDFPIDPRTLESGAISWTEVDARAQAAATGCPARAARRVEELEAAERLQSRLAAAPGASDRWCAASSGISEEAERETFYVISRLPEGARPLASFLEAAASSPGGMSEARRAALAWSIGVGVLRALADIHERGIHHGELSPESAMRDRIVVRPRAAGARELEVDVALQFPSPRLARLLEERRQAEVASTEQTDVARLAHILRAILHGRDVLDPDTSIDEMLLSRVFGPKQDAWGRFFSGAAEGALRGDPVFINGRLALLEGAPPVASGGGRLHDVRFTLQRAFARPAVRWGSACAGIALAGVVTLVLAWDLLFPPPTWTVAVVRNDGEGKPLEIKITTEGDAGEPAEIVAYASRNGARLGERIEFARQTDTWTATLPKSDAPYEVRFDDKAGTSVAVDATDAATKYEFVKPNGSTYKRGEKLLSADDGVLTVHVRGVDEDSAQIKPPAVTIDGTRVELVAKPETASLLDAGSRLVWSGSLDLSAKQQARATPVVVEIKDAASIDGEIRSIPHEITVTSDALQEGARVEFRLKPKRNRELGKRERLADVTFSQVALGKREIKFDANGVASMPLPESERSYTLAIEDRQVPEVSLKNIKVDADNDGAKYVVAVGAPELPADSKATSTKAPVTIRATDPDTASQAIVLPQLFDGEQALEFTVTTEESETPPDGSKGARKWMGSVRIPLTDAPRRLALDARGPDGRQVVATTTGAAVEVPARLREKPPMVVDAGTTGAPDRTRSTAPSPTEDSSSKDANTRDARPEEPRPEEPRPIPVVIEPEPEPVRRPGPPVARARPDALEETQTARIEPSVDTPELPLDQVALDALRWELVDAPPELQEGLSEQLKLINENPTRSGALLVPDHTKDYDIDLALISSEPAWPTPSTLKLKVRADDDAGSREVTVTDSRGSPLAKESQKGSETNLDAPAVKVRIDVEDPDSPIAPPDITVNGEPWEELRKEARGATAARFEGEIRIQSGSPTRIEIGDSVYLVRWEPQDPMAAGLPDYGWVESAGAWASAQIGVDASGGFGIAETTSAMTPDDLKRLVDELSAGGFEVSLASAEQVRAAMGVASLSEVVVSLVGAQPLRGAQSNPDGSRPITRPLGLAKIDVKALNPSEAVARQRRATFFGDAANPKILGLPLMPFPSSAYGKSLGPALETLLTNGQWGPKPWPADAPVKSGFARLVLRKSRAPQNSPPATP